MLTTYSDDAWVFAALQAGARGFLTKDAGTGEIQRAITDVAAGHTQLDPAVQRRLPDGLTPREAEVLAHIAAGESNGEIATALYLSEATVKTHIHHMLSKTGLRDRSQLVGYAFRNGLAGRD